MSPVRECGHYFSREIMIILGLFFSKPHLITSIALLTLAHFLFRCKRPLVGQVSADEIFSSEELFKSRKNFH
jgi:hypothetical protein